MKKNKIILTAIKESDGSFSAIGQVGKNNQDLIATQGDTWDELKKSALEAVNTFLKRKDKAPITLNEIDLSFDLPSFLDAYPQLNVSALSNQAGGRKPLVSQPVPGRKQATDRKVLHILAAVKQLCSKPSKFST
ncbi:hypothetical protein [Cesiribacter sp. SM1]|uniref:hypothetical protein n=1 Tax=Cesiribacter sp. SM1 TaxID=2861196 RepID=UPI001CD265E8|nr:hypothetical protein [Cesiribacter sp. SM1]